MMLNVIRELKILKYVSETNFQENTSKKLTGEYIEQPSHKFEVNSI